MGCLPRLPPVVLHDVMDGLWPHNSQSINQQTVKCKIVHNAACLVVGWLLLVVGLVEKDGWTFTILLA